MVLLKKNQKTAAGISVMTFLVAVAISLVYYQFYYVPTINRKPRVPQDILNPPSITNVGILPGSSLESQAQNFFPSDVRVSLGANNKVIWKNNDNTYHSVTSDNDYVDKISGKFDSTATIGLMPSGQTYNFTFTEAGVYHYHCIPHPWMKGTVTVLAEHD
ncbi:plastocyanin [Candidatus Nitrososphaera evergladensis SR1]|jgi:plastocyanin|uniref:Plastocyanin n=1 Tax=Candidatus Nitrososphaera evergladensis SR1 TaxID=1459636 RepID=A0A075MXV7_9ARCH|nr:plastocyanin/azurin family copper-binding protein [Candidatus Nitrososphaera evergladensis]AIF84124.1 plastocyanin [Candidatus Nitrososphaera evergladensis SR1]